MGIEGGVEEVCIECGVGEVGIEGCEGGVVKVGIEGCMWGV